MRSGQRLKLMLVVWVDRARRHALPMLFLLGVLGILFLIVSDEYEDHPPELAILVREHLAQRDDGSRLVWIIEVPEKGMLSVKPRANIRFEPGKELCISRQTGKRMGLEIARILYEGACKRP